jgi:sarcosine/dimethylglycine N-methyltransferase
MCNFQYDFTVKDVSDAYDGPIGLLWEALMGEHIHVGGKKATNRLANKLNLESGSSVLDVCSALGGPARYLASNFNVNVTGVDITKTMLEKARERTKKAELDHLIEYREGNALDLPVKSNSFDVVWGQDAWCYITKKPQLIEEVVRVCKPGGKIGFTDWILGSKTLKREEADFLFEFMIFPSMETLSGYENLLTRNSCKIIEVEDLQDDFAKHMIIYQKKLVSMKAEIVNNFSPELFENALNGVNAWVKAAGEGKVSRGLWIAEKK